MKRKTIVAAGVLGVLGALLVSCSTGSQAPPASKATSSPSAATSPVASSFSPGNNTGTSGAVFQSSLPLTVTQPADAATITGDSVIVQGKTVPGAIVKVNDSVVTADSNGAFSTAVSLGQGPNAIDVITADSNDNQGEVLLMVNAVPSASSTAATSPSSLPLTVTTPADSATLATAATTVKGQTAPGATVTVNGNADQTDSNGNFSIGVSLDRGANAIDVVAMDDKGNQNEVTIIVNVSAGS